MSAWEKRRNELHKKLVRQSNLALFGLLLVASIAITCVIKCHSVVEDKQIKKENLQLQEMRRQFLERQK